MIESIHGGSPSVLRALNLRMVLRKIRENGALSKADLMRQVGLSRPTINDVVASLLASGLITRAPAAPEAQNHRPGPVRDVFDFNAKAGTLLSVDVGAEKTIVLLADMAGRVFAKDRIHSRTDLTSTFTIGKIRSSISTLLEDHGLKIEDLRQAVISTPGTIDPESGRLKLAPQLPSLNGEDVAGLLGLTCPTTIDNEMRAAVVGEHWRGVAQGEEDVVYVGLGVGIGVGMILRGELYRGVSGAAGEIGYLTLWDPIPRSEGQLGPFEALAGADAFAARGQALAGSAAGARLSEIAGGADRVNPSTIIAAAASGDPIALELVDAEAAYIARAIAALVVILDPSMIVVGGGMSQAGETLLTPVRSHLEELTPAKPPAVVQSQLGDEAAAIGAICIAVSENDKLIERSFGIGD
ncbi:ROK family transcriptional regulator [Glaciibacter superstes]|uniref:ROK family transcriptional regulator n=1 Tax=Glaciibacter superstes TaxID=501023 RepID=UPI0003B6C125|nr:ROK family transcriptional regulator [Glaciibacter superstes]